MIILKNKQIDFQPIIDLREHNDLESDIKDLVENYVMEHTQKTIIDKKPKTVFYISGLAKKHHTDLAVHVNRRIKLPKHYEAKLKVGLFNKKMDHYWLQIGPNLVIDLAINQFLNSVENSNKMHYFISNNPLNKIYNLYNV